MSGGGGTIPHLRARAVAEDLITLLGDEVAGTDVIDIFAKTGEIVPGLRDAIESIADRQGITLTDSLTALNDLAHYVTVHGVREAMPGGDKWDLRPLD